MGYGSGLAMGCGVGHRCGSDLMLLYLWHRPAATAPVEPLAWEPPYAMIAALKKDQKKKKWKLGHGGMGEGGQRVKLPVMK